jgi:predicted glycosyl hydrolase (DUF1957 family)
LKGILESSRSTVPYVRVAPRRAQAGMWRQPREVNKVFVVCGPGGVWLCEIAYVLCMFVGSWLGLIPWFLCF